MFLFCGVLCILSPCRELQVSSVGLPDGTYPRWFHGRLGRAQANIYFINLSDEFWERQNWVCQTAAVIALLIT